MSGRLYPSDFYLPKNYHEYLQWWQIINRMGPYYDEHVLHKRNLHSYFCGVYERVRRLPAGSPPGHAATALTTYRRPAPMWFRMKVVTENPGVSDFFNTMADAYGLNEVLFWVYFVRHYRHHVIGKPIAFSAVLPTEVKLGFVEVISV